MAARKQAMLSMRLLCQLTWCSLCLPVCALSPTHRHVPQSLGSRGCHALSRALGELVVLLVVLGKQACGRLVIAADPPAASDKVLQSPA